MTNQSIYQLLQIGMMESTGTTDPLKQAPKVSHLSLWHPPPKILVLEHNEVHVWRVPLNQPARWVQQLAQTLSDDERRRVRRFHFERDRQYFTVGRGVLRTILSRYLDTEPDQLQFRYGPQGKPSLAETCGDGTLQFNLAHSHELALYAFTHSREIGIDLEYIRSMPDAAQIATRFFSTQENTVFRALPQSEKLAAFFNCWTRKEAYIKARGEGLSYPLDQFDVSLAPGRPAALLNVRGNAQETARWSLQEVTPAPGYVAALAVEGRGWHPVYWGWPK